MAVNASSQKAYWHLNVQMVERKTRAFSLNILRAGGAGKCACVPARSSTRPGLAQGCTSPSSQLSRSWHLELKCDCPDSWAFPGQE